MKKAWIENNKVRDICEGIPSECYHPEIAVFYDTDIEDDILVGAELVNGIWVNPIIVNETIEAVVILPILTIMEFKMLLNSMERITIKTNSDPIVEDFYSLIEDIRFTHIDRNLESTKEAIYYMESVGIFTPDRVKVIMS